MLRSHHSNMHFTVRIFSLYFSSTKGRGQSTCAEKKPASICMTMGGTEALWQGLWVDVGVCTGRRWTPNHSQLKPSHTWGRSSALNWTTLKIIHEQLSTDVKSHLDPFITKGQSPKAGRCTTDCKIEWTPREWTNRSPKRPKRQTFQKGPVQHNSCQHLCSGRQSE